MSVLEGVVTLEVDVHSRGYTDLVAISSNFIGADKIRRTFFLLSSASDRRGAHAHKACTQWFTLLSGAATLEISDRSSRETLELSKVGKIIKVPPLKWVEVNITEPSIIAVFTDYEFDEADYIRDWPSFLTYTGEK